MRRCGIRLLLTFPTPTCIQSLLFNLHICASTYPMNILLLGYGKMGKAIEQIARSRRHAIAGTIDLHNRHELPKYTSTQVDVAIEFSSPEAVVANLTHCFEQRIPVVCGTTGWLAHQVEIENLCGQHQGAFFYASNFSLGVHLFFQLNRVLGGWMNRYPAYDVSMEEVHHTEKKDAPSGTAITLANDIIQTNERKTSWVNQPATDASELSIISVREAGVPGTHTVTYQSAVDSIEITHTAHNREGFALGAVMAAEWLPGKQGVFGMGDMLGF